MVLHAITCWWRRDAFHLKSGERIWANYKTVWLSELLCLLALTPIDQAQTHANFIRNFNTHTLLISSVYVVTFKHIQIVCFAFAFCYFSLRCILSHAFSYLLHDHSNLPGKTYICVGLYSKSRMCSVLQLMVCIHMLSARSMYHACVVNNTKDMCGAWCKQHILKDAKLYWNIRLKIILDMWKKKYYESMIYKPVVVINMIKD